LEVKVPQNIDMQDKVIGPLTLVQFFYLLFGGLFIYLLNNWTLGIGVLRPLFWLIAVPVGLLSFALAFIKVQDRPFIYFIGSLARYLQRPRTRVWQKGHYQRTTHIVFKEEEKVVAPHKDFDRARVRDIVGVLDQPESPNV